MGEKNRLDDLQFFKEFGLDDRQIKEIDWARVYEADYNHGTAGHNQLVVIARVTDVAKSTFAALKHCQNEVTELQEAVKRGEKQLEEYEAEYQKMAEREAAARQRIRELERELNPDETTTTANDAAKTSGKSSKQPAKPKE
jgi:thiamine pyrophosphate-dependent acetolactate synthase large subunit-like protein